jgi:hypothetical protein
MARAVAENSSGPLTDPVSQQRPGHAARNRAHYTVGADQRSKLSNDGVVAGRVVIPPEKASKAYKPLFSGVKEKLPCFY